MKIKITIMKRIKYIFQFVALVALITAAGCKKESEGISSVTYYPDFEMAGQPTVYITDGSAYTDPGAKASENGVEIPVTVTISGDYFSYTGTNVDVTSNNRYLINYSATNKDGFSGSVDREVYVVKNGDLVTDIEGIYISHVERNGKVFDGLQYVMIRKTGANTYEISDAIGGYYDLGRLYGPAYRATGVTITANNIATNDFSFSPSGFAVGAFGPSADMISMQVDAAAKTITFQTDWDAGYNFIVTLTQTNL
jgi:hypothetical protein